MLFYASAFSVNKGLCDIIKLINVLEYINKKKLSLILLCIYRKKQFQIIIYITKNGQLCVAFLIQKFSTIYYLKIITWDRILLQSGKHGSYIFFFILFISSSNISSSSSQISVVSRRIILLYVPKENIIFLSFQLSLLPNRILQETIQGYDNC